MDKQDSKTPNQLLQPILPDAVYSLEAFSAATGLKKTAIRTAREAGLRVHYAGNRGFVIGRNWIEHLEKHGKTSEPKK